MRTLSLLAGIITLSLSLALTIARRADPQTSWVGYVARQDGQVHLVNASGTHARRLSKATTVAFNPMLNIQPQPVDATPALSPDGQWIAGLASFGWQRDVMLTAVDTTQRRRLTHFVESNGDVIRYRWSPDSRWLLVTWTRFAAAGIHNQIALVSVDGTQTIAILPDWANVVAGDWSPDGQWFTFAPLDELRRGLRLARVADGAVVEVAAAGQDVGWASEWSPDGAWIVYTARCDEVAGRCVYRIHPDGSAREKLAGGSDGLSPYFASYSPDGQWLAMPASAQPPATSPDLFVVRADGAMLTQVAKGMVGTNFEWSGTVERPWGGAGWLAAACIGLVLIGIRRWWSV